MLSINLMDFMLTIRELNSFPIFLITKAISPILGGRPAQATTIKITCHSPPLSFRAVGQGVIFQCLSLVALNFFAELFRVLLELVSAKIAVPLVA
jgi:hypothetical protein